MHRSRWLTMLAMIGGAAAALMLYACRDDVPPTGPDLAVVARRTLKVSGSGTGDGVVTSAPAGISCTITAGVAAATGCSALFDHGTTVTLTGTPKPGHALQGWYQFCTGFVTCQVPMLANRTVQARFMKGPFVVKVGSGTAGVGRGTVRSQPGLTPAISCVITNGLPATTGCQAKYPAYTEVMLTATPASGQAFLGWGGVCGGEGVCRYKVIKTLTIPATFGPAAAPAAATEGRWGAVFQTPIVAIHMHLLATGKVMLWGDRGEVHQWDPASPALGFVPLAKSHQVFCSGHSLLPDGRLLVAGGHIRHDHGLPQAAIFDPATSAWSFTPSMAQGRWYPTVTTLPNGELLAVAGANEQAVMVPVPEVWRGGRWQRLTGASLVLPYYPSMFVAPDGRVFMAGPERLTRYLDPAGTGAWSTVAERIGPSREEGSAVMYAPGKILYAGGGDPPVASAEVIDLNDAAPAWRSIQPMAFARRHMMATLLADGQVLVTHGTSGAGFNDLTNVVRYAELWNPATEAWTTAAREGVPRAYHATAVLLPDARVLSSGSGEGNGITYNQSELSAQIYSPPYLFTSDGTPAPRPSITSAPSRIGYGESFTIETPDAGSVSRGTLIRLASTTHSFNQSQVIHPLALTVAGGSTLATQGPQRAALAPPGPYMLFLINDSGVPSVARMVTIGP